MYVAFYGIQYAKSGIQADEGGYFSYRIHKAFHSVYMVSLCETSCLTLCSPAVFSLLNTVSSEEECDATEASFLFLSGAQKKQQLKLYCGG
jgi:hypothetical protein